MARLVPDDPPAIVFHRRPQGPAGKYTVEKLTGLLGKFVVKLERRSPVRTVEVYLDQPTNPLGKTVAFSVMLHVHLKSGQRYIAKAQHYVERAKHIGLETCIREAIKEIEEQLRRSK